MIKGSGAMRIERNVMTSATINLQVDRDTAGIFAAAPEEDRNKLSMLWGVLVHEYHSSAPPLQKLMDDLSRKAKSRGLTPGKLAAILEDK